MSGIQEFITGFQGGNKVNRFKISGNIGSGATKTNSLDANQFHIRTANLPASTFGTIPVNFQGRTVHYPGERTYTPWVITVLDDNNKSTSLYEHFNRWGNAINNHKTNEGQVTLGAAFHTEVWTVEQLAADQSTIKTSYLKNCWPISVGEINFDMAADNTLCSFDVVIAYSHWSNSNSMA